MGRRGLGGRGFGRRGFGRRGFGGRAHFGGKTRIGPGGTVIYSSGGCPPFAVLFPFMFIGFLGSTAFSITSTALAHQYVED